MSQKLFLGLASHLSEATLEAIRFRLSQWAEDSVCKATGRISSGKQCMSPVNGTLKVASAIYPLCLCLLESEPYTSVYTYRSSLKHSSAPALHSIAMPSCRGTASSCRENTRCAETPLVRPMPTPSTP